MTENTGTTTQVTNFKHLTLERFIDELNEALDDTAIKLGEQERIHPEKDIFGVFFTAEDGRKLEEIVRIPLYSSTLNFAGSPVKKEIGEIVLERGNIDTTLGVGSGEYEALKLVLRKKLKLETEHEQKREDIPPLTLKFCAKKPYNGELIVERRDHRRSLIGSFPHELASLLPTTMFVNGKYTLKQGTAHYLDLGRFIDYLNQNAEGHYSLRVAGIKNAVLNRLERTAILAVGQKLQGRERYELIRNVGGVDIVVGHITLTKKDAYIFSDSPEYYERLTVKLNLPIKLKDGTELPTYRFDIKANRDYHNGKRFERRDRVYVPASGDVETVPSENFLAHFYELTKDNQLRRKMEFLPVAAGK
ncbi:TPA: hypothetical protein HA246_06095 [Candidatus Woesearchaeota archaeon]|nr:hypothetical protein [Candidatus Woesearchaeota archaeon]